MAQNQGQWLKQVEVVPNAVPVLICRMNGSLLKWPGLIAPASRSLESMQHFRGQEAREPEIGRLLSWTI